MHAYPLRPEDVRIRIGSQERGPGESSSIGRSNDTNIIRTSHAELSDLGRQRPGALRPRTEVSSGRRERGEEHCCISRDVEGRIITTSFPRLSQPVPERRAPSSFYLFAESNSENTDSALAQVGRAVSPVPSSRKAENARWRDWLEEPSSAISSHAAVEGSRESLEYRISPGVSEMHVPGADVQQTLPGMEGLVLHGTSHTQTGEANQLLSSSDSSEMISRYEELLSRLRRLEQFDTPGSAVPSTDHSIDTGSGDDNPVWDVETHEETEVLSAAGMDVNEDSNISTETPDTEGQDSASTSGAQMRHSESMPVSNSPTTSPQATRLAGPVLEADDPDEAWKTFVFGDEGSEEVGEAAFEEARYEAARMLQPSDSPGSSGQRPESECNSNMATVGTLFTHGNDTTSETTDTGLPVETSASLYVACSDSLVDTTPVPTMRSSGTSAEAQGVEVNPGTSIVPEVEMVTDSSPGYSQRSTDNVGSRVSPSDTGAPSATTSMAVIPAQSVVGSSEQGVSGEQFRFAPPKLFVGSRSSLPDVKHRTGVAADPRLARRRRGRLRKRATDGRADIRALPNYSSDPIEESEDDGRPPNSLFPALELA